MDTTGAIENEVDLLQNKLKRTLRDEEERGANARSLGTRAEHLEERAGMFQTAARDARTRLWWRSFKWMAVAGILVLLAAAALYRLLAK